jgi:hypothetical protein
MTQWILDTDRVSLLQCGHPQVSQQIDKTGTTFNRIIGQWNDCDPKST